MRIQVITVFVFFFSFFTLSAQKQPTIEIITSGTNTSLRGMSIPSEQVIWVSGSNGSIGKSVNAGRTWHWMIVAGLEKRDFRDIEAFDSNTAIAMAVDNPAVIVKTTNGGATWNKVFERAMPGMFLDAMDFKNKKEGICIGDPLDISQKGTKQFYIIRTFDGGDTWKEIQSDKIPAAQPDEAIFAASGTNISFLDNADFEYAFVTGGSVSNLHFIGGKKDQNKIIKIPIVQGKQTTGTFSMATNKRKKFYCVGGDYKAPENKIGNYMYTTNEGIIWNSASANQPDGYRSCICIIKDKTMAACGPTGVDFAQNGTKEWKKVSAEGFNVCMVSKRKQVFFAGEKGKIGKLIY